MAFDIDLTGKAVLILLVVVIGLFLSIFAPSLLVVVFIFLVLAVLAYLVWIAGVRVNRWATGRRRKIE